MFRRLLFTWTCAAIVIVILYLMITGFMDAASTQMSPLNDRLQ